MVAGTDSDTIKRDSAISRSGVNTLKRDIVSYTTRLNGIFNDMDKALIGIESYSDSSVFNVFCNKYNSLKTYNRIIIKNIDLHIDELNLVVNEYENMDADAAERINKVTSNIQSIN